MIVRRLQLTRRDPSNIDVTAFLSLMVILVPFLLISAVFSRITILELQASSKDNAHHSSQDPLQLQVVVREHTIEVRYRGQKKPVRIERSTTGRERVSLAKLVDDLKARFPQSSEATILLEPQIPYDVLVQTMDTVRIKERKPGGVAEKIELFPQITLGEIAVTNRFSRNPK